MTFRIGRATVAAATLVLTIAGCSSSGSSGGNPATGGSSTTPSSSSSGATGNATPQQLYVSIGDSYAAGVQAISKEKEHTTRNGFAYQVAADATAKGYHLTLVNFGCAGATTTSVLKSVGCRPGALGPGAPSYSSQTQAAAAEAYITAHRGQVKLITVSIGGNDVTACAAAANITSCLTAALTKGKANLAILLKGLRDAAGPNTLIVGTTYPDVFLGDLISTSAQARTLASESVLAFQTFINPALKSTYEAAGAKFVDVTTATGAYGSLSQKTTLAPYGTIPVPVAKVCTLTYYCEFHNIHPRTSGYTIIAKLVLGVLPKA